MPRCFGCRMTPTVHLLPNPAAERRGQADVGPSLLGFASERQCGGSGLHAAGCSAGASIEGEIRDVAARSATLHGELLYNDFEGLFGMNRSVRTREAQGPGPLATRGAGHSRVRAASPPATPCSPNTPTSTAPPTR